PARQRWLDGGAPVERGRVEGIVWLGADEELGAVLAHGEMEDGQPGRRSAPEHVAERRQRRRDRRMVDEAVVDRDRLPAAGAVEAEHGVGHAIRTGNDMELAAPAVTPGIVHTVDGDLR